MAKILNVNYVQMPNDAKNIANLACNFNKEMKTAYATVSEMHANWYGKRYNALVDTFNNMIIGVNDMLNLTVSEIPTALITVANNYAMADTGSKVSSGNDAVVDKIENIAKSDDIGMRFITDSVAASQESVAGNFTKAISIIDEIESAYGKIQWESEASDAFKARFNSLKQKIVNDLSETNNKFKSLMEATKSDIQSTESSNTVL